MAITFPANDVFTSCYVTTYGSGYIFNYSGATPNSGHTFIMVGQLQNGTPFFRSDRRGANGSGTGVFYLNMYSSEWNASTNPITHLKVWSSDVETGVNAQGILEESLKARLEPSWVPRKIDWSTNPYAVSAWVGAEVVAEEIGTVQLGSTFSMQKQSLTGSSSIADTGRATSLSVSVWPDNTNIYSLSASAEGSTELWAVPVYSKLSDPAYWTENEPYWHKPVNYALATTDSGDSQYHNRTQINYRIFEAGTLTEDDGNYYCTLCDNQYVPRTHWRPFQSQYDLIGVFLWDKSDTSTAYRGDWYGVVTPPEWIDPNAPDEVFRPLRLHQRDDGYGPRGSVPPLNYTSTLDTPRLQRFWSQ